MRWRTRSASNPCLGLAHDALRAGGTAAAILNAANEVAVDAFLDRRLPFTGIARVIGDTLEEVAARPAADLESVLRADATARTAARAHIMAQAA